MEIQIIRVMQPLTTLGTAVNLNSSNFIFKLDSKLQLVKITNKKTNKSCFTPYSNVIEIICQEEFVG